MKSFFGNASKVLKVVMQVIFFIAIFVLFSILGQAVLTVIFGEILGGAMVGFAIFVFEMMYVVSYYYRFRAQPGPL